MIRLGMLSYWHLHAADYTREIAEHPGAEIVAVWDDDAERGTAEAAALGVPFVAELADLLARDDIDGVVVGTPTRDHRDVIVAAARAGKHVFSEKVIAATLAEAEEVVAAATEADIAFAVSMWRSDEPSTALFAERLAAGDVGEVTELRIRDGHAFALPDPENPDGRLPAQFWDPATAQGGILIDLCHPVYLVAHLLGLPTDVSATFGRVTGRELEDNAVVTMRYPNGAIAIAETSSVAAIAPFTIEAHGTTGSLVYTADGIGELVQRRVDPRVADAAPSAVAPDGLLRHRSTVGSPVWEALEVPVVPKRTAFQKWIAHVEAGTRDPANVELARRLSAIVEAAYRSDADGRRVALAEL